MSVDLDFTLQQGEFRIALQFSSEARTIGITGPSGSGKTTVLNVIAGTVRPGEGHVRVSGRVFADTSRRVLLSAHERNIGYVFQDGRLFPHLSVQQNLKYGRWFSRGRNLPVAAERIVDLLGIGHLLHRRPGGLSGGEQQRVAIGRALFAAPRLLLMDEPLAGLDAERRQEILPLIARVRDELHIPLIYVSHAEDEIVRLADEIVRLEAGRLVHRQTNGPRDDAPGRGRDRMGR